MNHKLYSGLAWFILAIILPLPLIVILNNGLVDSASHLFAYDLGIAAYVWWLADVYLATRPRWLINLIGMPDNYMIHGIIAVMAIFAATVHKFSSITFHPIIKNTGNIAWYLEIVLMVYAIVFMSGWLTEKIPTVLKFKEKMSKVFTHQVSLWLHRLNFVVITLIWLHVQVIPRLSNVPQFNLVFNVYTAVFLLLYLYKKFVADANENQRGKVVENIALTDNIQKLTIKLNSKAPKYKAGDFYFLSFKTISSEKHPFSVMSKPNNEKAEFIIQEVGDFTKKVPKIPVKSLVQMEGPFGLFDKEVKQAAGPIILYGLGTGIAPLLSLAQEYSNRKDLHIIWSINNETNYVKTILESLKKDGVKIDMQKYRFSNEQLKQILTDKEINEGSYFIVGSNTIVPKVCKNLKSIGIKKSHLFDEHLTM